jgi:Fe-S cluster assembly protein SufD
MFETSNVQQAPHILLSTVDEVTRKRWQDAPQWLTNLRNDGLRMFQEKGLPHRKDEEWKYTYVKPIANTRFFPAAPFAGKTQEIMSNVTGYSHLQLVFVNGFFVPQLSRLEDIPDNVEIKSLSEALTQNNPLVKKHLCTYADANQNSFVALNNAFIEDGAFIHIKKGTQVTTPIHLIYISHSPDNRPIISHPRNLIIADAESKVTIIEDYLTAARETASYFTNPVTEIVMQKDARVDHYKLQQEDKTAFHIATIQVHQEEKSHYVSNSISFGGKLTRNNIHSYLFGSHSHASFNGLYMVKDNQHVDNHTLIYHHSPNCTSSELYHGILDDKARGVFNGKIYVDAQAQNTDSQQTSRTLMLSDHTRIDAKPQLEIYADDVKCTHGATVGRLDEDALYYLQSRGIDKNQARKMMTLAFAQQVVDQFELEPLKELLAQKVAQRLEDING